MTPEFMEAARSYVAQASHPDPHIAQAFAAAEREGLGDRTALRRLTYVVGQADLCGRLQGDPTAEKLATSCRTASLHAMR